MEQEESGTRLEQHGQDREEENAAPLQGLRKTPCGMYDVSTWGKDEAGGIEEPNVQSHTAATSEKGTLGKAMPKTAPSLCSRAQGCFPDASLSPRASGTHTFGP